MRLRKLFSSVSFGELLFRILVDRHFEVEMWQFSWFEQVGCREQRFGNRVMVRRRGITPHSHSVSYDSCANAELCNRHGL